MVDRESQINASIEAGESPSTSKGTVELRDVCFTYPTRPDVQVQNLVSSLVLCCRSAGKVAWDGGGQAACTSIIS